MRVYYRSLRSNHVVVHQRVGPVRYCCAEMCQEWDILIGFGVKGIRRTTSKEVNLFTFRMGSAVAGITEIRYCPWCGDEIEVVRVPTAT